MSQIVWWEPQTVSLWEPMKVDADKDGQAQIQILHFRLV